MEKRMTEKEKRRQKKREEDSKKDQGRLREGVPKKIVEIEQDTAMEGR